MRVFYGKGAYQRNNGNLPPLRLVNMFVESSQTEQEGVILLSRNGLSERSSWGAGPIRGVFRQPNVFGNAVFALSGSTLYRDGAAIGNILGSGPVSFAAGASNELAINAGSHIYRYDGATLVAVTFPDTAHVVKVAFHDGLYLAARKDSHKWYWSAVLDADTWAALDFASAESRPDTVLDFDILNDTAFFFGQQTIEPWANTGDATLPYQRFEQRIFSKGIRDTGCLVKMDQALWFVSNENVAYALRDGPERISDHGIEERIAGSSSVSCFGFYHEGHAFFCIRLDDCTLAHDVATQQWCEFATSGRANFRAQCATEPGDDPIFGDDETGQLWTLDGWLDGTGPLERLLTFATPLDGGSVAIDRIDAWLNVGWTTDLAGQGSDPLIEMRLSHDAGATFGTWRSAAMGQQGEYRTRTAWRRCGYMDAPGLLGEMRVTDPVGVRMSNIRINEAGGGRGR